MGLIVDSFAGGGGASTGISSPNKSGVYVDGVEKIRYEGKRIRAEISIVCCENRLWRWGYYLDLRGDPWVVTTISKGPWVGDVGHIDRQTALIDAAGFLRERMEHTERTHNITNTPAGRELRQWLEDIGLGAVEQLALF